MNSKQTVKSCNNQMLQLFSLKTMIAALLLTVCSRLSANDYDVSSWLVANSDNIGQWTVQGGWFQNTGAGGSHLNTATGASLVAPFIEIWHSSNLGPVEDCSLTQQATHLPAGSYSLVADMMAVRQAYGSYPNTAANNVHLFADDATLSIRTGNDPPQRFTLNFTVTATKDVSMGVKAKNTNANWIAIDNIQLIYHATESELTAGELAKVRNDLQKYYSSEEIETLIAKSGESFAALEMLRKSVEYMPEKSPIADAVSNLAIGSHSLTYVSDLGYALCTVPLSAFATDYAATVTYDKAAGWGDLTIEGTSVASGQQYTFAAITAGKTYTLGISHTDGRTLTMPVTFTSLPVVSINGQFSNSYTQGSITVQDGLSAHPELLGMKAKWRGGITNLDGKHKRNYHVKLLDADGKKLERKFFGLRNDNSWILESCQVDMLRIRNRMLTDLWNDYSVRPYYADKEPKAKTGTRGRFVELVLNGKYRGIYCMTENMDRKQLKLKKYDETTGEIHGQLWKSKDWSYAVFMGHNRDQNYYPGTSPVSYNNSSESWDQYYVKYPDIEDVSPTDWQVLYDAVNFVCTASDADFKSQVDTYFDIPVIIDYYVLMETILSSDNHGKNMFFAVYDKAVDKKITLAVWDMDAAMGQRWSDYYYHSNIMRPDQDYAQYITNNEHGDYNLFRRLRNTDACDFNMQVRLRYRDLRQKELATDALISRFQQQVDELKTAGAAARESARWSYDTDVEGHKIDFDEEMSYLSDWITRRMDYLDKTRFDIGSLPSGIRGIQTTADNRPVDIYDLSGRRVATTARNTLSDVLSTMPSGLYIVDGRKVVVGR